MSVSLSCADFEHAKCLRSSCSCRCGHPSRLTAADRKRLEARPAPDIVAKPVRAGIAPSSKRSLRPKRHRPSRPRFTIDGATITDEYLAGTSLKLLAALHRVSRETVRDALRRTGVPIRRQGDRSVVLPDAEIVAAYEAGRSLEGLARDYGVTAKTIATHVVRAGGKVRPQGGSRYDSLDWAAIAARYEAGLGTEPLAASVGCSPQTLTRRLRARGVVIRAPKRAVASYEYQEERDVS